MTRSYFNNTAIVVLPPMAGGRIQSPALRKRLARSRLGIDPVSGELLLRLTRILAAPFPDEGLAALRMWGQTGDRPTVWIAAADPVYLEPRLDHLALYSLRRRGVPSSELRRLFDHLQTALSHGSDLGFARLGSYGYVRADTGIATAKPSAYAIHGDRPDAWLPAGEGADDYRRLISEVEMALHDHAVNVERVERGLPPVNSLWIWGGGHAPERKELDLPPLFSDDPLLAGYWECGTSVSYQWPADIEACLQESANGIVAVAPDLVDDIPFLEHCIAVMSRALARGVLSSVILLSRDGLRADLGRRDELRFWRRDTTVLGANP
ncbi:MAG: hypothetical protein QNJ07_13105 [Woeseiaceae bacterium]|nr:hypothetical protein [Woeseiaceae bacterium]